MPRVCASAIARSQPETPTAHWLEYADWWNPILSDPLSVERGMADVAGVIGTGVEWNESAVERYAV